MAPAHNSARPPVTTSFDEPSDDNPAVRAKGTVKPSDNPIILPSAKCVAQARRAYTSRTISGEMRCRSSSSLRSLQHVPRVCTPHLLPRGCSSDKIPWSCCCRVRGTGASGASTDHTVCLGLPSFFGSDTAVVDDEDDAAVLQHPPELLEFFPQQDMVGCLGWVEKLVAKAIIGRERSVI